jgi:putative transposon-encoded protein
MKRLLIVIFLTLFGISSISFAEENPFANAPAVDIPKEYLEENVEVSSEENPFANAPAVEVPEEYLEENVEVSSEENPFAKAPAVEVPEEYLKEESQNKGIETSPIENLEETNSKTSSNPIYIMTFFGILGLAIIGGIVYKIVKNKQKISQE